MSILHITTGANYNVTKYFIRFVNDNFIHSNHKFIVIDNPTNVPPEFHNVSNIIIIDRNKKTYRKLVYEHIKKEEFVILHSLCLDVYLQASILIKPLLMGKIAWVSWGADLYQWNKKKHGNLINKIGIYIRNKINLIFRRRIKYFVGIFPPDIKYFKKEFKSNAITYHASYTSSLYNPLYSRYQTFNKLEDKDKVKECINVQIGHSSTIALNHLEVLMSLEKFKDENIRLYLPLNYGDTKYGDIVEKKAKELFGDKAICIREMLPIDDYMKHLSTIDIAIFNTKRQIGLDNISPMLYMEKKIFMPEGSVMYNFYRSQEVDIWDYNKIADFDYNKFIQPLKFKGGKKYIVENELDLEHKIDMWATVFEAPPK